MCKVSINNMLWLTLMSKHLPMPERRQYAVRHSHRLCQFVSQIIPQRIFEGATINRNHQEKCRKSPIYCQFIAII